jgi:hypothetical protein
MIKTELSDNLAGGIDDDDVRGALRPIKTGEAREG